MMLIMINILMIMDITIKERGPKRPFRLRFLHRGVSGRCIWTMVGAWIKHLSHTYERRGF